jgi:serine/threonine-protein kinase
MGYCLNPNCPHPENLTFTAEKCQACGSQLLLHKRYRALKTLGKGGFGATFLAQDEAMPGNPNCFIKQLHSFANEPEVLQKIARKLFEREAKTLYKIGNHPQVPQLLNYFEDSQQLYLVQEYISGLTLREEVKRYGSLSEAGVKQFLREILPLLQYIHSQQMIHRDIKPANLIRREQDGKLVLIDFGVVTNHINHINQTVTSQSEQTALTANAVGTRGYAPPEQIAKRPVYASDIYAVGVTCIFLLTGKSPKDLDYNFSTGEIVWQGKVHVSEHLAKVLSKMLEVSVEHRYQSANEVLRALELEPYLDSLAHGMAYQPSVRRRRTINRTEPDSGNYHNPQGGYFYTRSIVQVATEIRALQAKSTKATSVKSAITPHQVMKLMTTQGSTAQKPIVPRKLDTDTLLTAYAKGRRNFALHNLSRLELQRADLQNVNFYSSKLDRTNLQEANLFNSNFALVSLTQANLKKANLSRAYLSQANLEEADLRGADLSYADLNNANLRGANLCGANLTGAKLSQEQLEVAKMNWMTVQPNGKRGLL